MTIYPAIDLRGGRCVRLTQGRADQEKIYSGDPVAVAGGFKAAGASWVHVVDLDGAFSGEPANLEALQGIARLGLRVQYGGGLRTREAADRVLALGASRIVVGTRAAEDPEFVAQLLAAYGDRIAVGIDARDGLVVVKGWVDTTQLRAVDLAKRMDGLGVKTIIHTDVRADGMLTGPNFEAQKEMLGAVGCRVIASGGVGRIDEVERFARLAQTFPSLDGVIVGKAIYEKRVGLGELLAACGQQ